MTVDEKKKLIKKIVVKADRKKNKKLVSLALRVYYRWANILEFFQFATIFMEKQYIVKSYIIEKESNKIIKVNHRRFEKMTINELLYYKTNDNYGKTIVKHKVYYMDREKRQVEIIQKSVDNILLK